MSASTVYDVRIRYLMDDMASGKTLDLDRRLRQTAESSSALEGAFKKLAVAATGIFGLHEAKKSFIDFNSEMEQSKITMAGILNSNLGGTFSDNMEKANDLVGQLQQRAKASVGTTKDMVQMASLIAQPVSSASSSMKDLEDMTVGAVVAARAFNIEASVAALDIDQAMRGQFNARDPFLTKILGPAGFKGDAGRAKFRGLGDTERFDTLKKALNAQYIKDMAKAQEGSFAGVLSTFQDNMQLMLGAVGVPLFKEITGELGKWNDWITKNKDRLEEIGHTVGRALLEGFREVKRITEFISDHWVSIAAVIAGLKLSSMVGGVGGMLEGGPLGAMGTSFINAAAKMNTFTLAIGGAILALNALGEHYIDKVTEREQFKSISQGSLFRGYAAQRAAEGNVSALSFGDIQSSMKAFKQAGIMNDKGGFDKARLEQMLTSADYDTRDEMAGFLGGEMGRQYSESRKINPMAPEQHAHILAEAMANRFYVLFQLHPGLLKPLGPEFDARASSMAKKQDIKVTINRIEVQSDDPDRFAFQFSKFVQDAVKNPSAARGAHAFREG